MTRLSDNRYVFIGGRSGGPSHVRLAIRDRTRANNILQPDFCIYNDVVVIHPGNISTRWFSHEDVLRAFEADTEHGIRMGATGCATQQDIDVRIYPITDFPPIESHSVVYHQESPDKEYIYIIGGRSYKRSPNQRDTITYRLDLENFSIQKQETHGMVLPEQYGRFRNERLVNNRIFVTTTNNNQYCLDLEDHKWHRVQWHCDHGSLINPPRIKPRLFD